MYIRIHNFIYIYMHGSGYFFLSASEAYSGLFLSVAVACVAAPHTLCGLALLVPLSLHSVFFRHKHALMFLHALATCTIVQQLILIDIEYSCHGSSPCFCCDVSCYVFFTMRP